MQQQEESLRWQIALGWVANLLVLTIQFVYMISYSLLTEADRYFRSLHLDPSVPGLKMLILVACVYALMPLIVFLLSGIRLRAVRWLPVAIAAFAFISNLLHHLSHSMFGGRPDFASHVPDLTGHAIGLWVLINSVRWARYRAPASATQAAHGVRVPAEVGSV